MSTRKYQRKARFPKPVRPAEEPFPKLELQANKQGRMSTRKYQRKARFPKPVRPAEEPFQKVNIEDMGRPGATYSFNITERSIMTTMEADGAPPLSLESKSTLLGEQGRPLGLPMLLELERLELAQPGPAHGASNSSRDESLQTQDGQVALNYLLPCEPGTTPAPPVLIRIGSQSPVAERVILLEPEEEETDDHGKAPMLFTTETAGLNPPSSNDCCKWFPNPVPTKPDFRAYKSDDPSKAPDGSLIHTLYKQLWVAGNEGMTLKELLASVKKQTACQSFESGSGWEHEVRFHLQNNQHVQEVKKYRLRCDWQPGLQRQPKPSANVACMGPMNLAGDLELSLGRSPQWNIEYPAPQPRATRHVTAVDLELSLGTTLQCDHAVKASYLRTTRQLFAIDHHKEVSTRKTTCQEKTEEDLAQWAKELEKTHIQQSQVHKQVSWWLTDPSSSQQATRMLLPSMKRKCSLDGNDEQPDWLHEPISGCSPKQQAEQGYPMINVSCSRRDVHEKWSCPLNAVDGSKFCEHHLEKRARYAANECQMIDSLDSNGCLGLSHSMGLAEVLAQQLAESIVISSAAGTVSCVKCWADHNVVKLAHGHPIDYFKDKVNLGDSDVPEKLELPASVVGETSESSGRQRAPNRAFSAGRGRH